MYSELLICGMIGQRDLQLFFQAKTYNGTLIWNPSQRFVCFKHELHLYLRNGIMRWKEMCILVRLLYEQSIAEIWDVKFCRIR